jgi:hypothetical protein
LISGISNSDADTDAIVTKPTLGITIKRSKIFI